MKNGQFEAEDFTDLQQFYDLGDRKQNAADAANALLPELRAEWLAELLKDAPEVLKTWFDGFEFWSEDGTGSEPTHTARLVDIRPIESENE